MLEIHFPSLFSEVVEQAKSATGGEARWVAAIDKAAERMLERPAQFHWMDDEMLIQSLASDEVYQANGKCKCPAFICRYPCWHRASARLWQRYLEAVAEHEQLMKVQVW